MHERFKEVLQAQCLETKILIALNKPVSVLPDPIGRAGLEASLHWFSIIIARTINMSP